MNINQQSEIENLFAFIKDKTTKPQAKKLSDDDLNKVRAFIVQSQRPL
jgi:chromosome segregation ATPase